MTTRTTKLALLGSASVAAAAFALPGAAQAQSTSCTLRAGTTTIYDCVDGTTGVATVTVTSGTLEGDGTVPLTISSSTGALTATGASLNGGIIQNTDNVGGDNGLTLNNTFAGGSTSFLAPGLGVTTTGVDVDAIDFSSNGGPVTITVGNLVTEGDNSFGVIGSGGSTTNITTGTITTLGGTSSRAAAVDSTGAITFNSGAVNSAGGGLILTSTDGPVTVTTSGAVNSNYQAVYLTGTGVSFTGSGVTTTNGDAVFAGATTGNVTLRTGAVSAINNGAGGVFGIAAATSTGAIDIGSCPTVSTSGDNSPAIMANSDSGAITINCGIITTDGANSPGVLIGSMAATTGPVSVTIGGVTTIGAASDAISIDSAGPVTVLNSGTITVSGNDSVGIDVATTGVGAVNVTTGVVTSTAANVAADPSFAAVRVVAAGQAPVSVVANGNVTTTDGSAIWAQSAGTASVTVNQGVTVSGPVAVTLGGTTGNVLVVNGTIQSTTAGNPAYAVAIAGAPLSLTIGAAGNIAGPLAFTTGNDAFVNNRTAGFIQSGDLNFDAGDDTFTNSTTFTQNAAITFADGNDAVVNSGIFNLSGMTDFGAGTDSFTNNAGGTVNVTAGATLLGLETLANAGTFNATNALTFDAGNTTVTNSGVLNLAGTMDFGAGTDVFSNTAAGTVNVTAASSLLGLETLNNAGTFNQNFALTLDDTDNVVNNSGTFNAVGTIDFAGGADAFNNSGTLNARGGATTFLSVDSFTNTGLIDLRDATPAADDVFSIGGAYTGGANARLGVDVVGANGLLTSDRLVVGGAAGGTTTVLANIVNPVIDTTGAIVVTAGAGTLAGSAFVLGGMTNAGFINYSLETRGNNVFVVSRPDEALFDQLFVNRLGNDIWYQSAEAYQAYAMSRRIDYGNERKHPVGIWAQLYGSRDRVGDRDRSVSLFNTTLATNNRFETHRRGAQGGLDFGASNFLAGITAGYEHAKGDTDFGTDLDIEGYNYGAYAQFGAQQGIYAGLLLKRDKYDIRVVNNLIGAGRVDPEGKSTGIDGEVGFRFGNPGGINFDVGAGLSWVRTKIDDYSFGNIAFDNDRFTSKRGRLQARATFAGAIAPFIDGKIFREFGDASDITVRSGLLSSTIEDVKRGTWGRVEAGLGGGAGGGPLLSAWVDLGDVRGWGLRGGFRF